MEPLVVAALCVALFGVVAAFLVHTRSRSITSTESDSSDDEASGPLSVNVEADQDEQDALLPTFAGLLRSPWHSVTSRQKDQPKMMRSVRRGSRSMSLTIPLPLGKKKKPAQVPVKKVHVPYFFPLLHETAEWWQTQQCTTATDPQPTPEQEPEAGLERQSGEDDASSSKSNKEETQTPEVLANEQSHRVPAVEMAATLIEVGGE